MANHTIIFENRSKPSLSLQNNLSDEYASLDNFHNVLLDLIDDDRFIGLCESGDKYGTIMYLSEKNIIKVKLLSSTEGGNDILAYPTVAVAAVELFVLLSVAAVVTPVLLWLARTGEPNIGQTRFCTMELNYCMDIISKFSNEQFTKEMYDFFLAVENKETVQIKIGA